MNDPMAVGDRLFRATTQLMAALHAETIGEKILEDADPDMAEVSALAVAQFYEQTGKAWRDCIAAMDAWAALRLELSAEISRSPVAPL